MTKCCICNKKITSTKDIEVIELKGDFSKVHLGSVCSKCYARILLNTKKTMEDKLDPLEEDYFRGVD